MKLTTTKKVDQKLNQLPKKIQDNFLEFVTKVEQLKIFSEPDTLTELNSVKKIDGSCYISPLGDGWLLFYELITYSSRSRSGHIRLIDMSTNYEPSGLGEAYLRELENRQRRQLKSTIQERELEHYRNMVQSILQRSEINSFDLYYLQIRLTSIVAGYKQLFELYKTRNKHDPDLQFIRNELAGYKGLLELLTQKALIADEMNGKAAMNPA